MENLDLMVEVERFMSHRGLTHDDSIQSLIEALSEEME